MITPGMRIAIAVLTFHIAAQPARAQAGPEIIGLDGKPVAVALETLERRSVVTQDRGLKATFEGVALRDVLARAGAVFGEKLRGTLLAQVVLVTARDGYQVAYGIAELDAAFTDQVVLLADRRDGKPLLPDTGPWQIIVPNDKRPARWIRQVTRIEVRQLK
jgi:hypothetical protein